MNSPWQEFYDRLLQQIEKCKVSVPEMQQLECSFGAANQVWDQLQGILSHYTFSSTAEEIDYYKNIQPLFLKELYFFSLCYHAQMFKPAKDIIEEISFFSRELTRLGRFKNDYPDFCEYYLSGKRDKDEALFTGLHKNNAEIKFGPLLLKDGLRSFDRYDSLIACLKALEEYYAYVKGKMQSG